MALSGVKEESDGDEKIFPWARTVSLNCFMGSPVKNPAARTYLWLSEIVRPSPAQAITFVDEKVETI